jgi:hypothetical protein
VAPYIRWAALAAIGTVSGCAQQPTVTAHTAALRIDAWKPQDQAVYVQDWDCAAQRIADGLTNHSLLRPANAQAPDPAPGGVLPKSDPPVTSPVFFIRTDQDTIFLRQLKAALETEITSKGGLIANVPGMGGVEINLRVDVVPWGSRRNDEPYVLRREAVW